MLGFCQPVFLETKVYENVISLYRQRESSPPHLTIVRSRQEIERLRKDFLETNGSIPPKCPERVVRDVLGRPVPLEEQIWKFKKGILLIIISGFLPDEKKVVYRPYKHPYQRFNTEMRVGVFLQACTLWDDVPDDPDGPFIIPPTAE